MDQLARSPARPLALHARDSRPEPPAPRAGREVREDEDLALAAASFALAYGRPYPLRHVAVQAPTLPASLAPPAAAAEGDAPAKRLDELLPYLGVLPEYGYSSLPGSTVWVFLVFLAAFAFFALSAGGVGQLHDDCRRAEEARSGGGPGARGPAPADVEDLERFLSALGAIPPGVGSDRLAGGDAAAAASIGSTEGGLGRGGGGGLLPLLDPARVPADVGGDPADGPEPSPDSALSCETLFRGIWFDTVFPVVVLAAFWVAPFSLSWFDGARARPRDARGRRARADGLGWMSLGTALVALAALRQSARAERFAALTLPGIDTEGSVAYAGLIGGAVCSYAAALSTSFLGDFWP